MTDLIAFLDCNALAFINCSLNWVLCMGYSWVEVVVMGMSIIASPGFIRGRTCGGAVITCSKTDGTQS